MQHSWTLALLAAAITANPLPNGDVLPLSVLNEVEHAISAAPTNAPPAAGWTPQTNGITRTELAVRLVSMQGPDGRWTDGTNDVTSAVLRTLQELAL